MAKILSDKELIEWLRKQREVLRNHRCVNCSDLQAHSKLHALSDSKGESDICIDQAGSAILEDIRKRVYQYEDTYYEERLFNLWGQEL